MYLDQQVYIKKFLYKFLTENPSTKDTAILFTNVNSLY